MSSKEKNIYIFLSKVILVTLLIVLFIRGFLIESFTLSSSQMESTLINGDKILIDKTAYGIRMPVTILSIPFTFDNIGGVKSYSTAIQFPYKRFFSSGVERNDIVLLNNPADTGKPLDKRELILSRCVALPGDTIQIKNDSLLINDRRYMPSPYSMQEYPIKTSFFVYTANTLEALNIPVRDSRQISDSVFILLNRYEAFILNENLPEMAKVSPLVADTILSSKIMIPFKGKIIELNEENLVVYKQIILDEQEGKAKIEKGKLYIDNKVQDNYTFKDSYYWMLSDNTVNSTDSRAIGFVPFRNIIGKARYVWYNPDKSVRCFSSIK